MARFRLTNPLVTADSSVQQNFEGIQSYLNKLAPTVPVVTSLPTSPADGTVIDYIADSTNGVAWRFRYRAGSGSSYKWEFVGGSPLWSEITTLESYGAGVTTYGNLATVGPSIALPFAGDYEVEIGCSAYHNTTARAAWMSYQIGGTGASDSDGTYVYAGSTNTVQVPLFRPRLKTGLGAVTLTVGNTVLCRAGDFVHMGGYQISGAGAVAGVVNFGVEFVGVA